MFGLIAVRPDGQTFKTTCILEKITSEQAKDPKSVVEHYLHATPVPTKEFYPKSIEVIGPGLNRRRRGGGVNINMGGGSVGGAPESKEKEDGDD